MRLLAFAVAGPYAAVFTLAIVTALVFSWRAGRHDGLPMLRWSAVLVTALLVGYVGSQTLFLDFRPIAPGEKTNLGALLFGVPALALAALALKLRPWHSLDLVARPTLAAMAIGRVGCFVAGCCAGKETTLPWAVSDRQGHLVHPVQLYEAALDVLLLLAVPRLARRVAQARPHASVEGSRFLAATAGYVAIRFATEFLRAGRDSYAGLNAVQWSLLALALLITALVRLPWRRLPVAFAPQLGALLLLQAPAVDDPPAREIVVGGGTWRSSYDQTLGYEYANDCDGDPTRWPTLASRRSGTVDGTIGYRFRTSGGHRVTIAGRYQAGTDRVRAIDSGPATATPQDFRTRAAGGALTVEAPFVTTRLGLMQGQLGSTGRPMHVLAPTLMLRVGDDERWFGEVNLAERSRFGATGEFSYVGIGYTWGRDRTRTMFGIGDGGKAEVIVPLAGFEAELSFRGLSTRDDGSRGGQGWRLGIQRAIPVP